MASVELKMAQLERVRRFVKKRDIDRRIREFDKKIEESENELREENEKFDAIRLTAQLYQFSELSRTYAEILELFNDETQIPPQDNVDTIKAIKSAMDERKGNSTKVMKLFTGLMRNKASHSKGS